ncbi:MAG: hypothetical protein MI922_17115 [Bacteroidales bacterium]|nr:hypothetical protein [Bacteroidales bacterium]
MKTRNYLASIILAVVVIFTSCEQNPLDDDNGLGILPANFKVDVPNSLTANDLKSATVITADDDTLSGDELYELLTLFVAIGEGSATLVEEIIYGISYHGINKPMDLTYVSDDDKREKHLIVQDLVEFEGKTYDHTFLITDVLSENNTDGGKAMQIFWNTNPIVGVAILKPYNIDFNTERNHEETMYRIDYSEAGTAKYEATMEVTITNLPLAEPSADRFSIESIKMFVGKNGDIVDVYGNSNHPNAYLFKDTGVGFNWAFVASGYESKDLGVAELALPPSNLEASSREAILDDYAVKKVMTEELNYWFLETWGIRPDSTDLANYLKNADAPGYFADKGFVAAGTSPGSEYDEIDQRIENLTPYKPSYINSMEISFK